MRLHTFLAALVIIIIQPAISNSAVSQEKEGYNIEVKLNGIQNSDLYLGFHYGNKQFIKDTVRLDENGHGVFSGAKTLQQGIYLIITPSKKYFEILIGEDQHFSFTANTSDFIHTIDFQGSKINEAFNEYQKFMIRQNRKSQELRKRLKAKKGNQDSTEVINERLSEMDKEVKEKWKSLVSEYPGTILATIIQAMQTPETPDFEIPEDAENPDSIRWIKRYQYFKKHYFDNIDLSDERLVRTPIIHNKIKYYFDNVMIQQPDSIIPQVDKVIQQTRGSDEAFQYVTRYLINHYQKSKIMGMDKVFVHIAEKYYLSGEADWMDEKSLDKLRERVQKIKPNLIGNVAPSLKLPTINNEFASLHDLESKYTILYFWEPGCGHCKKVTPKIRDIFKKYTRDQLEVFAVYTQSDREEWRKYVKDKDLNWVNVWDPQYTSNFRDKYDIYSTPTIYLIDQNNKIVAKRIDFKSLKKMLEQKLEKKEK
jgi:thiol-disulfide isomerase/thioredoxin